MKKSLLTEKQYKLMEERLKNHKSGKSKSYTIEEVRHFITPSLQSKKSLTKKTLRKGL
jgi:hypothetical protein